MKILGKILTVSLLLALMPFFSQAQIINEAIMRQSITANIPTNGNKGINALALRTVLQQMVSFTKLGANGVAADSLATANYIPFFKTTGVLANSPFRVSSGNVGWGTGSPNDAIDVVGGNVDAASFKLSNVLFVDQNTNYNRIYKKNGVVGFQLGASANYYDNNSHIYRTTAGAKQMQVDASGAVIGPGNFQIRLYPSSSTIAFQDSASYSLSSTLRAADFKMITGAASSNSNGFLAANNGYIGLGPFYNTPRAQLHVSVVDDNSTAGIETGLILHKSNALGMLNDGFGIDFRASAADSSLASIVSAIAVNNSNNKGYLSFRTNNGGAVATERMRIDHIGNVGIGTASISDKLFVSTANADEGITLESTHAGDVGPVLEFQHNSASPAANDYPGILRFMGRDASLTSREYGALFVRSMSVTNGAHFGNIALYASGASEGTTNSYLQIFNDTGNVGIGIGASPSLPPVAKLHIQNINDNVNSVTQVLRIDSQSSGTSAAGFGSALAFAAETAPNNTETGGVIESVATSVTSTAENFDMTFKVMTAGAQPTEKVRITSSGKMLIGTSSPNASAKLHISSTSEGALLPVMTTSQFNNISSKAKGLEAYSSDDNGKLWYDGTRTVGFRFNGTKFQGYESTSGTWVDLN